MVEGLRDNTPGSILLAYEHQAYLAENIFFHYKFLKNPEKAKDNPQFFNYMEMLADFDKWRDSISQTYLESWPAYSATFKSTEDVQKERISVARQLMGEGVYSWIVQNLKILGLTLGSEEMAKSKKLHESKLGAFQNKELAKFRQASYAAAGQLYFEIAEKSTTKELVTFNLDIAKQYAEALDDKKLLKKIAALREKRVKK